MSWTEVEDPVAGPGEVVLDVAATAVNRADLVQREGHYPPPPGASGLLGLECSGRIAEVGPGVVGWTVGDEVCALLAGGGYAEKVTVPVAQLLPVPPGVDLVVAGSLPEVACTVWSTVMMHGGLSAGETLLVHGASSGVGSHALQVARAVGAQVVATANSARFDVCRELGADVVIDYSGDVAGALSDATEGRGADVILDNMGGTNLATNVAGVALDGRIVVIGVQGALTGEVNLAALLARRGSIAALSLRSRPVDGSRGKGAVVAEVRDRVWPMIADGRVRPVVHARFSLSAAAHAHRMLAAGGVVGKLLLVNDQTAPVNG
ncbi:NAD(P)H-quinone oxidoreductase [Pseudonocardia tropica]